MLLLYAKSENGRLWHLFAQLFMNLGYAKLTELFTHEVEGFSDLQHLKEQLPEMKIIALGYHEVFDELMGYFLAAGFDGYWNKYHNWSGLLKQLSLLFP